MGKRDSGVIGFVKDRNYFPEADLHLDGIELKKGVRICVDAVDTAESSLGLELVLESADEDESGAQYDFEVRVELIDVLNGRHVDMLSFLEDSYMDDLDEFMLRLAENVIMNEAELTLTDAGLEVIVSLRLGNYHEELRIARDEAEYYLSFDSE